MSESPELNNLNPKLLMDDEQLSMLDELDMVEHSKATRDPVYIDNRVYSHPETDRDADLVVATTPAYNLGRDLELEISMDEEGNAAVRQDRLKEAIRKYYEVLSDSQQEKPVFMPNDAMDVFDESEQVPVYSLFQNNEVHAATLRPQDRGAEKVYRDGLEVFKDGENWSEHMERWENGDDYNAMLVPFIYFPEKAGEGIEEVMPRYTNVSVFRPIGDAVTADYNPLNLEPEDDDYEDGNGAIPATL